MTRDEAIAIEKRKLSKMGFHNGNENVAAANIDALIELGLLKVDEPVEPKRYIYIVWSMHKNTGNKNIKYIYENEQDASAFVKKAKELDNVFSYLVSEEQVI